MLSSGGIIRRFQLRGHWDWHKSREPLGAGIRRQGEEVRFYVLAAVLMLVPAPAYAGGEPDCSGVERWPTSMAFVHLKNAGVTTNKKLDFTKTKTSRIASQKIGDDLYRQVHHITFTEKSGNTIEVVAVNEASSQECSMSGVEVFVVAQHLGG